MASLSIRALRLFPRHATPMNHGLKGLCSRNAMMVLPTISSKAFFHTRIFRPVPRRIAAAQISFPKRSRRYNSTTPPNAEPPLSLSQRLKKLSKEFGYVALGVYLGLSALDFPFCFLAVRYVGAEKIGHWEDKIVRFMKSILPDWTKSHPENEGLGAELEGPEKAAPQTEKKDASIWTELALAYAIHKSFIFIRVPLTAAVTPKVVKVLRSWGWDIGKKRGVKGASGR